MAAAWASPAAEPAPDRLVVLTFDDSSKSHYTVVRPILKKHRFGATFFITEGWDFATNKKKYMTWEEIAELHRDGFEIGNHTRDHQSLSDKNLSDLPAQLRAINEQCRRHGIPVPVSFAYPGNAIHRGALPVLKALGPSAGDARPGWTLDDFKRAVGQAQHGKIAVLQFHGVPDTAHDWVSLPTGRFEEFMQYLADNRFTAVALRDLAKYVDFDAAPTDPFGVIEDRKRLVAAGRDGSNSRPAKDETDLRFWLENMATHDFTAAEAGAALGWDAEAVASARKRLGLDPARPRKRPADGPLLILPYPGGRHPRSGFRDGAIRPQRETKASVFAPWDRGGYAVADVPEAVWFAPEGKAELLYLAHTHVPTIWDKKGVTLPPMEWRRKADGSLHLARTLPNGVTLGSTVMPGSDGVRMAFRVTNGSGEKLTGLRVQMCVMLAGLAEFGARTNDNKVFARPFAACRDDSGRRWIITAWEHCGRAWGNPACPCLHADPVVPDCLPGETRVVRGWLSFYQGTDIDQELHRLKCAAFQARKAQGDGKLQPQR